MAGEAVPQGWNLPVWKVLQPGAVTRAIIFPARPCTTRGPWRSTQSISLLSRSNPTSPNFSVLLLPCISF